MTKVCARVCVWGGGHIFCFVEYFDKSQFFVTPPALPLYLFQCDQMMEYKVAQNCQKVAQKVAIAVFTW